MHYICQEGNEVMYDSISTLDLIKLLCIKQDRYNKLPKIRMVKRHNLLKERDNIVIDFLNRDIFDQSDAICSILLSIYKKDSDVIIPEVYNYIVFNNEYLDFIFNADLKNDDNIIRNGVVRYIPKEHTFHITMEPYTDYNNNVRHQGYVFTYTKNMTLNGNMLDMWETDVHEQLKSIYMTMLLYIVSIVNSPTYNFVKEEYIMH